MRRFCGFICIVFAACSGAADPLDRAVDTVQAGFAADVAALRARTEALDSSARSLSATNGANVRIAFEAARDAWKRVEYLVEHFAPTAADEINGPAIDEIEPFDPNHIVLPAEGFQVIEEYLYPEVRVEAATGLAQETGTLLSVVRRIEQYAAATPFSADNIWEAARLQLLRIVALGVSGFDSPVAHRSIPEAGLSADGVRSGTTPFLSLLKDRNRNVADTLVARLDALRAALEANPDFDSFDRLSFVRDRVHPALAALIDTRDALGIGMPRGEHALRADARTLFAPDVFDAGFFAAPGASAYTPALAALGERLFFDPILSADGSRSCALCHQPALAFTDGLPRSLPLASSLDAVLRNAPTIFNVGLQVGSFYDLRTEFLEDQVADVVRNRDEMHGSLDRAVEIIGISPAYAPVIDAIGADADLDERMLRSALAAYMRSLVSLDSRIDRHLRGEDVILSDDEIEGFNLFMGKAGCGTCHFAPLFNGTMPPAYRKTDIEILGVPALPGGTRIDPDSGAFHVLGNPLHLHGFKTPTVRNAALTSPYMHNGVFATLEEVVDFYDVGGGAGLGIELENQTLPPDSLGLSEGEKRSLVRFLEALTDTSRITRPES